MKQLFKKLQQTKSLYHISRSHPANQAHIIEQRLAYYYQDRQLQRIRQLY